MNDTTSSEACRVTRANTEAEAGTHATPAAAHLVLLLQLHYQKVERSRREEEIGREAGKGRSGQSKQDKWPSKVKLTQSSIKDASACRDPVSHPSLSPSAAGVYRQRRIPMTTHTLSLSGERDSSAKRTGMREREREHRVRVACCNESRRESRGRRSGEISRRRERKTSRSQRRDTLAGEQEERGTATAREGKRKAH